MTRLSEQDVSRRRQRRRLERQLDAALRHPHRRAYLPERSAPLAQRDDGRVPLLAVFRRGLGAARDLALYYNESGVYEAKELPPTFKTWRAYRDYLVETTPLDRMDRFRQRFADQRADEETCRQQVKQLLLNDWENSVPVSQPKRNRLRERLWDLL